MRGLIALMVMGRALGGCASTSGSYEPELDFKKNLRPGTPDTMTAAMASKAVVEGCPRQFRIIPSMDFAYRQALRDGRSILGSDHSANVRGLRKLIAQYGCAGFASDFTSEYFDRSAAFVEKK